MANRSFFKFGVKPLYADIIRGGTNGTGITTHPPGGAFSDSSTATSTLLNEHKESGRVQFTDLSDEEIVKFVNGNHSASGHSSDFAVGDLFKITKIIIDHATHDSVVDDILKSANPQCEKVPSINDTFISPLCILKSICCEMSSCKDKPCSGEETSIQTRTDVIFEKLKAYPWEAKVVLALASFALEYGDLWHLAQLYGQCNQLTDAMAILKRVPILIKHATLEKRKEEVSELNHLIQAILQVTESICRIEDYYIRHRIEDVPTLKGAVNDIPTYVFWTITALVACAVKVTHVTRDEVTPYSLSYLVETIGDILEKLKELVDNCEEQIERARNYQILRRNMLDAHNSYMITEVVNTLFNFKDDGNEPPAITIGNKKIKVETFSDLVNENYVLFYMSGLDNIGNNDIESLKQVHSWMVNKNWKMVWIPIVEDSKTIQIDQLLKEWESEMPWYKVQFFSSTVIKYLKETKWSYKGVAKCVVMNPQGELQYHDALAMIRQHGNDCFDHFRPVEFRWEKMQNEYLLNWSKDETNYSFLFEGKDESWIELKEIVNEVRADITKKFGVSIQLFRVVVEKKAEEDNYSITQECFWSEIKSLKFSLANHCNQVEYQSVTKPLLKLLTYEKRREWVMVIQGSKLIDGGCPDTILEVMKNMPQGKPGSTFGSFITVHIADCETTCCPTRPDCCQFDIPGNPSKSMTCPVCEHSMETISVSYKCCHPGILDN